MPTDIRLLDRTMPTPALNLACDEALLNDREAHGGPGVLRFWESSVCFIVVGYANRIADEVHQEACGKSGVRIHRRCSGGGSVVQGPGCLNYSLILPIRSVDSVETTGTITDTNCFVMERNRWACEALVGKRVDVAGHTDLAMAGRKFSGNAQRRRRDWFLFHGTFLYNFDLVLLENYLRPPPREPEYRGHRSHADFVTQLPASAQEIQDALRDGWNCQREFDRFEFARLTPEIEKLGHDRYERDEWNHKW